MRDIRRFRQIRFIQVQRLSFATRGSSERRSIGIGIPGRPGNGGEEEVLEYDIDEDSVLARTAITVTRFSNTTRTRCFYNHTATSGTLVNRAGYSRFT
jgi:hypothetical protein